ncbi:ribosomal RNA small subunit methyltransferase A, partial [Patescibacteria group bacterium]
MLPKAKKSYGQNWLIDQSVVEKIIAAAGIKKGETVLEIGPGTGVLTEALVKAGANVVAVEADKSLIKPLQEKFGDKIKLIHGNILHNSTTPPLHHLKYHLIANIPYNITSEVIRKFLTQDPKPYRMILMVQFGLENLQGSFFVLFLA